MFTSHFLERTLGAFTATQADGIPSFYDPLILCWARGKYQGSHRELLPDKSGPESFFFLDGRLSQNPPQKLHTNIFLVEGGDERLREVERCMAVPTGEFPGEMSKGQARNLHSQRDERGWELQQPGAYAIY